MAENLEEKVYEGAESPSSAIRLLNRKARLNPLFQATIRSLSPKEQREFYSMFTKYMNETYQNNPQIRRIVKSYDLADKVENLPEGEGDYARKALMSQAYAEPGRNYHYINNISGGSEKAKEILKKSGKMAWGITKEAWPGLAAGTGWYFANRWAEAEAATTLTGEIASAIGSHSWSYWLNPFHAVGAAVKATGAAASHGVAQANVGIWNLVKTPLLYVVGGYVLFKTLKYFLKTRKQEIAEEKIKKLEAMQKALGVQNQRLYEMAGA